jgi:hypothetical protein
MAQEALAALDGPKIINVVGDREGRLSASAQTSEMSGLGDLGRMVRVVHVAEAITPKSRRRAQPPVGGRGRATSVPYPAAVHHW